METGSRSRWWMPLVMIFVTTGGMWLFQKLMFPASFGGVGLVVGYALGAALAALLEDYIDQNSE